MPPIMYKNNLPMFTMQIFTYPPTSLSLGYLRVVGVGRVLASSVWARATSEDPVSFSA